MFGAVGCKGGKKVFCKLTENRATALTKKQQAIEDREYELLVIAKALVVKEGFASLTMDKIAAASPYSKGTIYNHFSSKEDVISALGSQALLHEISLFLRAQSYQGSSREKVVAMHVAYHLFARIEPILSMCVLTSRTPWVIEKTSPERLAYINGLEEELVAITDAIFASGLSSHDLTLPEGMTTDSIIFANWSMAFGSNALINNAANSSCVARILQSQSILMNINIMLDGMGWLPLSTEHDYLKVWQHIEETVFSDEVDYIASLNL
ncbi:TetR/AcrR family transcriptional regulator [Photobacterium swingsii]|uniref:TetR/AcrR family transcriptional regulator n=1 Tax=Photobacterium swingsii TaxID=680026 RepID=A0A2T3P9D2_9GAMM|nr:TetR/AcrR family transcriptional regulator [Photobacterium swingsii]PSW25466.1 TetR/AcrR family transcriptional regulator [Photobacterium swingsii]